MISIEVSILKGLLYDSEYASKVTPFLKDDYFDDSYKIVYNKYKDLYEKYNKIPSMEAMAVSLQDSKLNESAFAEVAQILSSIHDNKEEKPDTQWLVDETESFCRDKAIYKAIFDSMSILDGGDKKLDKNAIPKLLEDAIGITFDSTIGLDYFEDYERRFKYYTDVASRLQFPLKALQELTNGGLPPKTLSAFLAGTNVGKSAMMCFLAGEFMKAGKNVLYITLEMAEEAIQERIDANLFDMRTDELKNPNLDFAFFKKKVEELKSKTNGRLVVREYPTGAGNSAHFRHLLNELKRKKQFVPDIIFIDYINICASARLRSMAGVNSYTYIKAIAEELRGLAVEFNVPIMTATQTNRDGSVNDKPDMTSTSESFGLPQTLDWFAALVTNSELMEMNRQLLILLKTRFGNKNKSTAPVAVQIDFDKMRYKDVVIGASNESVQEVKNNLGKTNVEERFATSRTSGIPDNIKWD